MDKPLSEILDAIPAKPPRSKLEPYYDLIRELRRRSKTYREIAQMLEEHVGLRVDHSTVYDFVRVRARGAKVQRCDKALPPRASENEPTPESRRALSRVSTTTSAPATTSTAHARIEALKRRTPALKQVDSGFHYEEGAPLQLTRRP